jgi:hypothetical protein
LLSAKKIQAGKNGRIEAWIKAEDPGQIEKQITMVTNDPHHVAVTLFIKAVVEPEIGISAPSIVFDNTGKEARKEILLTIPAAKPIKIISAVSTDPNIAVSLEPVLGSNGKQMKLIAIRKPDTKPGDHYGQIVIKTTSRLTPEFSITSVE